MKDGLIRRCMILALAGCMMMSGSAYAENAPEAERAAEEIGWEDLTTKTVFEAAPEAEYAAEEIGREDIAAKAVFEAAPEAERAAEETGQENLEGAADSASDEGMPEDDLAEILPGRASDELVGAKWYHYIELDTPYDFIAYNGSEYNCYSFTALESGTYCMDLTKTARRVRGEVYYSEDGIAMQKMDGWNGYYDTAGFHINLRMEAGLKYVFYICPDEGKADSGKFRLRRATKEVSSVSASVIGGRYLAAGLSADGEWGTEEDGTTDYTRWEFDPARMLDMYKVTVTYADGTKYTWTYAKDGFTIGSTYLRINAEQDFEGWKVGTPAYCFIRIGNFEGKTRVTIPYVYFTDVQNPSHAYYKAIYWAAGRGITRGYSDNTFGIDRACTRGEAVMFLWKVMGQPEPKAAEKSPFSDVASTHSFYKAILWASQKGITKGFSDGTFGIDKTCTRGQIMTFIWRAKGQPAPKAVSASPFSDVSTKHAYYKAILWGSQLGITKGFSDGTFGIDRDCTRGQIVTFLYRS